MQTETIKSVTLVDRAIWVMASIASAIYHVVLLIVPVVYRTVTRIAWSLFDSFLRRPMFTIIVVGLFLNVFSHLGRMHSKAEGHLINIAHK